MIPPSPRYYVLRVQLHLCEKTCNITVVLCFYRSLVSHRKWLCHIQDHQTEGEVKATRVHDTESCCVRLWHIRWDFMKDLMSCCWNTVFICQMCFSKMELYFKVEYKWMYYITENISLLFIGFSPFVCWRDIHKAFSV